MDPISSKLLKAVCSILQNDFAHKQTWPSFFAEKPVCKLSIKSIYAFDHIDTIEIIVVISK